MSEIQEIPLDVEESVKTSEEPTKAESVKEEPIIPEKKATGRPKGVKGKAPRAKRAPAPRKEIEQRPVQVVEEPPPKRKAKRLSEYLDDSSSDESLDAAAMRRVMKSVKKQQVSSMNQKQQMYAAWFGR